MLLVIYQWKGSCGMARPSPTVRRRRLRYELRRLRTERGLTIEDVQERSNGDVRAPTLSRWETGERSIRPADLRVLLDIYDVPASDREALLVLARQAKERGWWQAYTAVMPESFQAYVGLEAEASLIREYAAELVPGLLQTEDYYREFLSATPPTCAPSSNAPPTESCRQTYPTSPNVWNGSSKQ
jgi:transcriptional regulator with XRE-family HTH domain